MKYILTFYFILITTIGYSQQIDTLYYDKEWKGVDNIAFADFYRVTITPDDPNFPKRFRDYTIDGKLQTSGNYISIDKYDDSKSIFDGKCTQYHNNGVVSDEINYSNGKPHGISQSFYDNGTPQAIIEFKDGKIEGQYKAYDIFGNIVYDGTMLNENFSGIINTYDNGILIESNPIRNNMVNGKASYYGADGKLFKTEEYVDNILNGESIDYHSNGSPAIIIPYKNGNIEGTVKVLDNSGVPTSVYNYSDNLKVGLYEYSDETVRHKGIYKLMNAEGNSNFKISLNVSMASYPIKTQFNMLALSWNKAWKEKYIHLTSFDINIYNKGNYEENCKIEDVEVYYIKKNKSSNNMALSEKDALKLYETVGEYIINSAYDNAQDIAYTAATQTSRSYSGGATNNNVNVKTNTTSNTSSVAAAIGAVLGANNSGDYGGAVGGAAAKANSNTQNNTNTNANQTVTSFNIASNSTTDGYTQYQIYQQEKENAVNTENNIHQTLRDIADKNSYSQFSIKPNSIILKQITSEINKDFDSIIISFTLNGVKHSATWTFDEVDNSIVK